jgi:D-alanyl-D-alanine dipeptidase
MTGRHRFRSHLGGAGALLLIVGAFACGQRAGAGSRDSSAAAQPNTADLPIAPDSVATAHLVDIQSLDSSIVVDARYATPNNFTGAPLPGYDANRALFRREGAEALARVAQAARAEGYRLRVFDAYRPARATDAMVAWCTRTGREDLLRDGYIASKSRHNMGLAIDLTLVESRTGRELDMGTAFDVFSTAAHTANATGEVANNRSRLKRLMESRGFVNYDNEWWHFSFAVANPLRFDLAVR